MNKFIILLVIFFTGCKNYITTNEGGVRPKHPKFSLSKHINEFTLQSYGKLDTNSVYVSEIDSDIPPKKLYSFYRFFSQGRVYYGFPSPLYPTEVDFNNLNKGAIGYYSLKGDTILIEMFGLVFSDYQYMKYEGIISNENIVINRGKLNAISKYNLNEVYKKENANLVGKPNW